MKDELFDKLKAKHPGMFDKLQYGIECEDGWYNIIDAFCHATKGYSSSFAFIMVDGKPTYPGNAWVVPGHGIFHYKFPQVIFAQIKEKFGGIRLYTDIIWGDEWEIIKRDHSIKFDILSTEIYNYIRSADAMASSMSYNTCEMTGRPGRLRRGGWIKTLCDEEALARGYVDKPENGAPEQI